RGRLKSGSTPPCGPSPQAGRDFTLPFSLPLLAGEGPGIGVQKTSQMALNAHGEGVHHIAFQIEDTDRTAQHLKDHGIEVLQQGLYSDASGMYTYVDSEAVLGVMLELLQNF
ncbi:MAG TPA: VOC family protein, partial [Aggregatilineaceae bacterium]|nr:VOC family protein [Aggregatilineaceae bacterium]